MALLTYYHRGNSMDNDREDLKRKLLEALKEDMETVVDDIYGWRYAALAEEVGEEFLLEWLLRKNLREEMQKLKADLSDELEAGQDGPK